MGSRFFGKWRGIVIDRNDPLHMGRVRCKCPSVIGNKVLPWALPCSSYGVGGDTGIYAVPEKGAGVWLEFEQGDADKPVWAGTWYLAPEGQTQAPAEAYKSETPGSPDWDQPTAGGSAFDSPDVKVIKTKGGQTIVLDDRAGQTKIQILDNKGQGILIRSEGAGQIHLYDAGGNHVELNAGKSRVLLMDKSGSFLCLDGENGDVIIAAKNNLVLTAEKGIIETSQDKEQAVVNTYKMTVGQFYGE